MVTISSRALRNLPDEGLISILRGDDGPHARAALEELFHRYNARVHAWSARLLGDDGADDATQEVFLRLISRRELYEERGNLGAWLYVVTRNHCLNVIRQRDRERLARPMSWQEDTLVSSANPLVAAERSELRSTVRCICSDALRPIEQKVVHLRYQWGMRVKEIGLHLRLENVSGARTHLSTATRKIRNGLVEHLGENAVRDLMM